MNYHEHKRETFAVFWNQTTKDTFISSSWDGTVKIVCFLPPPWTPSIHIPGTTFFFLVPFAQVSRSGHTLADNTP